MSLTAVNNATKPNVNHAQNQPLKKAPHSHQEPSVQNTKGRLQPTEVEQADQLTGDQNQVQTLNKQASLSNPLISQQFNSKVATSGV